MRIFVSLSWAGGGGGGGGREPIWLRLELAKA